MNPRRRLILIGAGVLACALGMLWSCKGCIGRIAAAQLSPFVLQEVESENSVARSFLQHFPAARVYLSDYSESESTVTWNGIAGLHDRYIIIVTVEVRLVFGVPRTITERGIDVLEVESVRGPPGGQITISYEDGHHRHASQWQAFVDSGGDLRALGFQEVKTDQPVSRFAEALQGH